MKLNMPKRSGETLFISVAINIVAKAIKGSDLSLMNAWGSGEITHVTWATCMSNFALVIFNTNVSLPAPGPPLRIDLVSIPYNYALYLAYYASAFKLTFRPICIYIYQIVILKSTTQNAYEHK